NRGDIRPYQVLARAMFEREQAGVVGSLAVSRAAAEIAVLLGSSDPRDREMANAGGPSHAPLAAIARGEFDDLLFPPAASNPLRTLFRLLGDRLAKHLGTDVRRYGVGRGDRLRKGSDPLAGVILETGAEMGIDD